MCASIHSRRCSFHLKALVAIDVIHAGDDLWLSRSQNSAQTLRNGPQDRPAAGALRVLILFRAREAAEAQLEPDQELVVDGLNGGTFHIKANIGIGDFVFPDVEENKITYTD